MTRDELVLRKWIKDILSAYGNGGLKLNQATDAILEVAKNSKSLDAMDKKPRGSTTVSNPAPTGATVRG